MNATIPAMVASAALASTLSGCAAGNAPVAQLAAAQPATIASCTNLASGFSHASTTVTAATVVAAGTLTNAGAPVPEHCLVTGRMNQRVSPVDGQTYAIGFEMRLPTAWNGRFLYQGNGGTDGVVAQANGGFVSGRRCATRCSRALR